MISRRNFTLGSAALATTLPTALTLSPNSANASSVEVDENGMHVQDWFLESFMEIGEDQTELSADNKHLAVLFEQRGCPYCREMHEVNFAKKEIKDYITEHFGVLQINIWGAKGVIDLDGVERPEKEFARKWRANFTPTIVFLRQGDLTGIPINLAEAARMPGYLKPFHFLSMFEFVAQKKYEDQMFQSFLQDKFDRYKAEGKKPDIW